MKLLRFSKLGVLVLVVAVAAVAAGSASAGSSWSSAPAAAVKYASTSDCPAYAQTQPFTAWADLGYYFLAPGGNFENTLTGWTATGGRS